MKETYQKMRNLGWSPDQIRTRPGQSLQGSLPLRNGLRAENVLLARARNLMREDCGEIYLGLLAIIFALHLQPIATFLAISTATIATYLLHRQLLQEHVGTLFINIFISHFFLLQGKDFNAVLLQAMGLVTLMTLVFTVLFDRLKALLGISILWSPSLLALYVANIFFPLATLRLVAFTWVELTLVSSIIFAFCLYSPLSAVLGVVSYSCLLFLGGESPQISLVVGWAVFTGLIFLSRTPSWSTLIWAIGGGSLAASLLDGFVMKGAPSLEVAIMIGNFCLMATLFGSHATSKNCWYFPWYGRLEDKLFSYFNFWFRFKAGEARITPPFSGKWQVYQAFNGPWTHKGRWRYCLDFIKTDSEGHSHRKQGTLLEDYYAFGQEILSPATGYIVAKQDHLPDNPLGRVDNKNRWGNHIIIRDFFGAHIVIAHLKQGSIRGKLYSLVEAGQVIAECGNSGYSPEPHIHIHVQRTAIIGAPTIPFHIVGVFEHLKERSVFHSHGTPKKSSQLECAPPNENLVRSLSFILGDRFVIRWQQESSEELIEVENKLDEVSGLMYFSAGNARLYHTRYGNCFCFTSYQGPDRHPLKDLLLALPRVPMMIHQRSQFIDPVYWSYSGWRRIMLCLRAIFLNRADPAFGSFCFDGRTLRMDGSYGAGPTRERSWCQLDPLDGIIAYGAGRRNYEIEYHLPLATSFRS